MKKFVTYDRCLPGGGILRIIGIRRFDKGILVLTVEYFPAVVPLAA